MRGDHFIVRFVSDHYINGGAPITTADASTAIPAPEETVRRVCLLAEADGLLRRIDVESNGRTMTAWAPSRRWLCLQIVRLRAALAAKETR